MINKFTQKAQDALNFALEAARSMGHSYIGTEHLMLGLVSGKDSIAARVLISRGVSEQGLKKSIAECIGVGSEGNLTSDDMTPRLRYIIEAAAGESEKSTSGFIGTEHLLNALLCRRDCVGVRLIEAMGVSVTDVKSDLSAYIGSLPSRQKDSTGGEQTEGKKTKRQALCEYGRDLTQLAASGKTDPVFCRDRETERLIRILCRRSKNNPCLVGEPGVGKTAVVEGLAQRIVSGNVPSELLGKRLIMLDITAMIAGAKYRGEFEDRIKNVIEEVRKSRDIILFVDEMHIMVGAGAAEGAIDASNILKPSLARGEIRMIGATTPKEYRSHIEKDPAFERRFQQIDLAEPSALQAEQILFGIRERYEKHHGIRISDDAVRSAVALSVRYIHDRFLPDKAIDLLDEACACLRLSDLTRKNNGDRDNGEPIILSPVGSTFTPSSPYPEEVLSLSDTSAAQPLPSAVSKLTLTSEDVARVVSEQTGIPCQSLLCSENKRLLGLEELLSNRIVGQDKAISAIAGAVRRGRVGLANRDRPICSFLFLGSTGVGKSELCRVLAKAVFESDEALIRFDMSEYMEKHSVSKLIGAPPGYVGYGEGGKLTDSVRRRPYCILLFDEIEKAHPDVLHLLLQMLEDGRITDSSGKTADLSSCMIIMTSNLLSSDEGERSGIGFAEPPHDMAVQDIRTNRRLLEFFRPEFLNRIDEIILFSKLGEAELCKIADMLLSELCCRAKDAGINLTVGEGVSDLIVKNCLADTKGLGARPIRRELVKSIESPLAEYIISEERASENVKITADSGKILLSAV